MADKKDNNKQLLPNKSPRSNYQLWFILIAVAVIFGVMYATQHSNIQSTTFSEFQDMITRRDVKKIVLIKKQDLVEITLKPEALKNARYKEVTENSPSLGLGESGPHYQMEIGSVDK